MPRNEVMLRSLASTHTVLGTRGGEFVSLLDPPEVLRPLAAECRNVGTWPVLVGVEGQRDTMLSSPIILYDYPRIAPESPGDSFDGTEIDELLTLCIQALTPDEKRHMSGLDGQSRALLHRSEALTERQRARLHGAVRGFAVAGVCDPGPASQRPATEAGTGLRPGDRVRLRPRGGADAFDLLLTGQAATVVAVEQDFEGRTYLAVTVDEDPGRDLGREGQPGHRFFYRPEEVEPFPVGGEASP
jgi:hydrogenase maturation protease